MGKGTDREQVKSGELRGYRACGMLGAAGLGKTYEISYLAELDRKQSLDVRIARLASLGVTSEALASQLRMLATGATATSVIYLDALDEVMVPVKTTGLIIGNWIRDALAASKPALRISCRSAVWPSNVDAAIREVYGGDFCLAYLQPISVEEVRSIVSDRGVNGDDFVDAVNRVGATSLAQLPLTLEMLLRVYAIHGSLPTSRKELFAQGIEVIASERAERWDDGTAIEIPTSAITEGAERLACLSLLSGRLDFDLSDSPPASSIGRVELGSLPKQLRIDETLLRAIGRSGLCDSDGTRQFRFAHRQFAEYLAGRTLSRLLFHQARSLLETGLGWEAGVAGPLRETAAFAAMESDSIAAWVTECDPEVIGLSDVADDGLRKRATQNLLDRFRRHQLTDAQLIRDGIELGGFQYSHPEDDLRQVLRTRQSDAEDVLECAIRLIDSWNLASMSDDLADLILDVTAPQSARESAGYALSRIGTTSAKRRLLPLIRDDESDPDQDLKGLALRSNWPDALTVSELLTALTRRRVRNYGGAYSGFLFELERSGFDAHDHIEDGLLWARQFLLTHDDIESLTRIARRIAIAALDQIDKPEIATTLADLILEAAKAHSLSPLSPPRSDSVDENDIDYESPVLARKSDVRRKLMDELTARVTFPL